MSKTWMMITAALGLGAVAMPANAAQYNFSFTFQQALFGSPFSGMGVFTTSDIPTIVGGQTAYAITSITGSVNGSAIVAPTAATYGNYFTTGPAFLDGTGLRFFTASGNDVRFFFASVAQRYQVNTFSPGSANYVTATSSAVTAAVPEPATWAMMIGGFGVIGFAARRRRNTMVSFA